MPTTEKKTTSSKTKSSHTKSSHTKSTSAKSDAARSMTTTDHDQIRSWAEERGAHPACVKGTGSKNDVGLLRLDFPGYSEDKLQEISWEEFFEKFDERSLALVYQETTAGGETSNFNKLVSRTEEKPKTRTAR